MSDYDEGYNFGWEAASERTEKAQNRIAELERELAEARNVLRRAREGYASEAITGLPCLPVWRDKTIAAIDAAIAAMQGKQ